MYTDEDLKSRARISGKAWLLTGLLLVIMGGLFLLDGIALLERAGARLGIISDSMVLSMIDNIEYNYYYDDVFETEKYLDLKSALTDKPIKTYRDFEAYVYGFADLAKDDFTYFYFDSISDMRWDYSDVNASDYEDAFASFSQEGIPVIQFKQFAYETGDRVIDALTEIHKKGDRVVVLDLTDNPGGMIDQCVEICDVLLPETVIFEEKYNDRSRYQYVSDPQMLNFDTIVILLNDESASCSEILALTLKEHLGDKVLLVGNETFGKKVTQSVNQDDGLRFSLFLVTAEWSVEGKTTEDLNGYLLPWRGKHLKGFEDGFKEARNHLKMKGLIK